MSPLGYALVGVKRERACFRKQKRRRPSGKNQRRVYAHSTCARVEEWPGRETTVLAVDKDDPEPPELPDDNCEKYSL